MNDFLFECARAVLKGDKPAAIRLARQALGGETDLVGVIERGFSQGIREAGELWERGEYFLPDLAFSAEAMKSAMEILEPGLAERPAGQKTKGTVVIGTIQGDIHDIGKTLVATMLSANGYHVIDLGADVAYERFVTEADNHKANLLCMSALLTTTMIGQKEVIRRLNVAGQRHRVKVLVGGAPTSVAWAGEIGADGYAENAVEAVRMADELLA